MSQASYNTGTIHFKKFLFYTMCVFTDHWTTFYKRKCIYYMYTYTYSVNVYVTFSQSHNTY